jgi:hypothetical protein
VVINHPPSRRAPFSYTDGKSSKTRVSTSFRCGRSLLDFLRDVYIAGINPVGERIGDYVLIEIGGDL